MSSSRPRAGRAVLWPRSRDDRRAFGGPRATHLKWRARWPLAGRSPRKPAPGSPRATYLSNDRGVSYKNVWSSIRGDPGGAAKTGRNLPRFAAGAIRVPVELALLSLRVSRSIPCFITPWCPLLRTEWPAEAARYGVDERRLPWYPYAAWSGLELDGAGSCSRR